MSCRITSYGAAGTVTGSAHVIEIDGVRFLIDLGMFQGGAEMDHLNRAPLGFDPTSIDAMILTHGHLDHVGRLPLLVRGGYDGPIFTTAASRDVARLILVDSARVQAEDFRRQRHPGGAEQEPVPPPLYTEQDAYETLDLIRPIRLDDPFLVSGVSICFGHAGHILGSAFIQLTGREHRVVASGDIGHWGPHVVPDPNLPGPADILMVETTYGDEIHPPMAEAVTQMVDIIHETTRAGGNVIVPSFALERTQDVLHQLRLAYDARRLPKDLQVYLDSPLAIRFTQLYRRYPESLSESVKGYILQGKSPFRWENVHFTISSQESRQIERRSRGSVIMAGSGMATGGRVLFHLKANLERAESSVIFVGYQAEGTLGRQLVDGAERVVIDDQEYEVRAKIYEIDGFSAHADQLGILRWSESARPKHTLLIHGEDAGPRTIREKLAERGYEATISERDRTYEF